MKIKLLLLLSFLTCAALADPPTPPTTSFTIREWGNNVLRNEVCNGTNAACGGPVSEHPKTTGVYSKYEESLAAANSTEEIWIHKTSYFKSAPAYHSTTHIYEWLTNEGGGLGQRDTIADYGQGPVETVEAITSITINEPEFAFGGTSIVIPTTEYGQTLFSTEASLGEWSKTVLRGVGGTHHYSYTYRVFLTCEKYEYDNSLNLVHIGNLTPTKVGNNLSFYDATEFNLPGWWYVDVTLGMWDANVVAEVDLTPIVLGGHYYKYDFLQPQLLSTMPYSIEAPVE